MKITNAIKLPAGDVPAKAVVAIRKATGLSLADIKSRAANDKFIIESALSDDKALAVIIALYDELLDLGIKPLLYQGGREVTIDFLSNVADAHRDTAKEVGLD